MKFVIKYTTLIAITWAGIIFIACCTPGKYIPTTNLLELLSVDKLVHAFMFCVLVYLWFLSFSKTQAITNQITFFVVLLSVAYGGLLEIMQSTIFSERSGDWFDFMANALGCFIGRVLFEKKILFKINRNI